MAKLGFWTLVLSEVVSMVVSLRMLVSPSSLPEAWLRSGEGDVLVRAWAATWLALGAVLLVVLFTSFRRAERWAWLVMMTVPLVWLAHFVLAPGTVQNLALALITACALAVTIPPRRTSARPASD